MNWVNRFVEAMDANNTDKHSEKRVLFNGVEYQIRSERINITATKINGKLTITYKKGLNTDIVNRGPFRYLTLWILAGKAPTNSQTR